MKILVVEDETSLKEAMCDYIRMENYRCESAETLFEAQDLLLTSSYELMVLDLNLPDGNGMELLKWVKKEKLSIGVLIVSARDSLQDKLEGLEIGADDYITKPFHLAEFNARIKAILRRRRFDGNNSIVFDELELHPDEKTATVNGQPLSLTAKQYDILEFFVINKNKVLSKEAMANYLWEGDTLQFHNLEFIYNHVKNIRKLIKAAGGKDYIQTVYGVGYKFSGG